MSIGLLIVTHNQIGADLLATARDIIGKPPLEVAVIDIKPNSNYERKAQEVEQTIIRLDHGDGVLVLTDLFGATPSNIALKAALKHNAKVVAGINLPMLIRVFNYPGLPLDKLIAKAVAAGHDSVFECNRR
jgi:PTS system ascorbate-specific IIA component